MPPYGLNFGESPSDDNERPLKPFTLLVDGRSIPTQLSQRAMIGERDVTDQLRKIGLSESQIFETFGDCDIENGCSFTNKQEMELERLSTTYYGGAPWKVAETAYWEQVFPARREIEIEHQYPPFIGMAFSAPYQEKYVFDPSDSGIPTASRGKDTKEACLHEGARQAITRKIKSFVAKGASWVWVTLHDVEYVLGTGRNWKGPIADFKLRIEKDSPSQLVSLCFPGQPKRISDTLLEFSHSNFAPQDKLVVYFYTVTATKGLDKEME